VLTAIIVEDYWIQGQHTVALSSERIQGMFSFIKQYDSLLFYGC